MTAAPINAFAFFARGVDGFYLPADAPGHALVRSGTPEVAWARSILPPDRVLEFHAPTLRHEVYPTTESLLANSDLAQTLIDGNIRDLLLSSSCTPAMHAWSRQHGIRFLAADFQHQRKLENKIWFDRFLRSVGIRCPAGGTLTVGRPPPRLPRGRLVLQIADSMGGEGTFFVDDRAALASATQAAQLTPGQRCLVRQFVEGLTYGITIFVTPGAIALSAIRSQCYYPHAGDGAPLRFAGVQWIPSQRIEPATRREIDRVLLKLGDQLYRLRYFGVANVDFLVDTRQRVWIIECNPRMSAATPQWLARPELSGGLDCGRRFLQGFQTRRRYTAGPLRYGMPETSFAGATLDLLLPEARAPLTTLTRSPISGSYQAQARRIRRLGPDIRVSADQQQFELLSFGAAGQQADGETTLGSIFTSLSMYAADGTFNALAQRMAAEFRYTD